MERLLDEVERFQRENAAYFEDNCRLHNEQAPERTEHRLALAEVERMLAAIAKNAAETDFCILCEHHPSSGHHKTCSLAKEPK